jgi:threonine aldolase
LELLYGDVETNIVIFRVEQRLGTAAQFVAELKAKDVLALAIGVQQVRMVTHLDVSEAQCKQAARVIREVAEQLAGGKRVARELEPAY